MEQEKELEALVTFIKNECPVEYNTIVWPDFNYADVTICAKETAENFIRAGYRKVPEGFVILSREEYERLKSRPEEVYTEMSERMKEELRIEKEIGLSKVRKVLQELYRRGLGVSDGVAEIHISDILEMAENYGIEIY